MADAKKKEKNLCRILGSLHEGKKRLPRKHQGRPINSESEKKRSELGGRKLPIVCGAGRTKWLDEWLYFHRENQKTAIG